MKIEWSPLSIADRELIFGYIEMDSPRAAAEVDDRIEQAVDGLAEFLEMGRLGRVAGTRELVIAGTPYLAAYLIEGGIVRILRVLHGAQQWPEKMPEKAGNNWR